MSGIELLRPDWPAPEAVCAAVTTRRGGCSEGAFAGLNMALHVGDEAGRVRRNRRLAAAAFAPDADFQWLRQVHGNRPALVSRPGQPLAADSLITRVSGIVLCVLAADCLPVFVCDRAGEEAAIIHAGWRGMSAGIIENTLAAMRSDPEQLSVWLGPAILSCHYEVGEDVRAAFLGGAASPSERDRVDAAFEPLPAGGKYRVDLARMAAIKLRALGVSAISGGGLCTYCEPDRFFSHRRDRRCGRMANMIGIRPAAE